MAVRGFKIIILGYEKNILKPRIVIDKPRIMNAYPRFLVLLMVIICKLGILDL